jgi:transcription initiation factor IIF auxiliary subunit
MIVLYNSVHIEKNKMSNYNPDRLSRIETVLEINQQQIGLAFEAIQRLTDFQLESQQIIREEITSIRAAVDRIDRVLDYLMRRDGENRG